MFEPEVATEKLRVLRQQRSCRHIRLQDRAERLLDAYHEDALWHLAPSPYKTIAGQQTSAIGRSLMRLSVTGPAGNAPAAMSSQGNIHDYGSRIYTEDKDNDTLSDLGPLRPAPGIWSSAKGTDVHPVGPGSSWAATSALARPRENSSSVCVMCRPVGRTHSDSSL